MNWYEWDTAEDFNTWHDNLCFELGYPETPVNQATGLPDETAQKTEKYCVAVEVEGKFIAAIEEQYAEGLTATSLRPFIEEPPLA